MPTFKASGSDIFYEILGDASARPFLWGHGWGHSRENLMPLAAALEKSGRHFVLDFPGFGKSPPPPEAWDTAAYADAVAEFIKGQSLPPVIWVGHSFGGRVGLQLASRHPDLVAGLFLVAAAGLKPKKPLLKKLYFKARILIFKCLKKLIPLGLSEKWLMGKFGSPDYRKTSGVIRQIFIKAVNEDLTDVAKGVRCPVYFVYGENDTETPPEIGKRFRALIPGSEVLILNGQDHYSVLSSGRHPVIGTLNKFVGTL